LQRGEKNIEQPVSNREAAVQFRNKEMRCHNPASETEIFREAKERLEARGRKERKTKRVRCWDLD